MPACPCLTCLHAIFRNNCNWFCNDTHFFVLFYSPTCGTHKWMHKIRNTTYEVDKGIRNYVVRVTKHISFFAFRGIRDSGEYFMFEDLWFPKLPIQSIWKSRDGGLGIEMGKAVNISESVRWSWGFGFLRMERWKFHLSDSRGFGSV